MGNADTSFVVASNTNWPTGAVGNFIVCINRGQPDEEKILCATQAAKTVTVATSGRGFDGTTAQAHAAGATVECVISAFDADEWNQHTNASTGVHGVATVAGLTETQTFTNKTLTSPTVNGGTLDAASTIGGVSGTSLAADRTAWTAYTPTFTNITSGAGTFAYKLIGKTLHLRGYFTGGTATSSAVIRFSLPASLTATTSYIQVLAGVNGVGGGAVTWTVGQFDATTVTTSAALSASASVGTYSVTGVVEVQ
jgi:hypothetical protein